MIVPRTRFSAIAFLAALGWGALGTLPLAAFGATPAAAPKDPAGVITVVDGSARITRAGAGTHPAQVGEPVFEGDLLASASDGEVHVRMQDTGFMVLRANSRVRIVSYRADGGDEDKGVFRLLAGGLRSVTGWIGKFNPGHYQVHTSTATIGIRGTDHETRYVPEGSPDGEPGTYDRVYAGETTIESDVGQARIAPDQAGFVSARQRERPRLLAAIPPIFRPGPHEAEINAKHAEIQKQIDERRQERRRAIAEARGALDAERAKTKSLIEQNKAAARQRRFAGTSVSCRRFL